MSHKSYDVLAYYFPNYHLDRRNEAFHGKGWSEWELVKSSKPRFAGHEMPRVPAWGYEDEADPKAMARKIDAAADHGVTGFIFDWYWYNDGPFLQRGLDEGFLGAANNLRIKFALMWANHDWIDIHPARLGVTPKLLYPGRVTRETFKTIARHAIDKYFRHPSYWKIDGKPYFSVYELTTMIEGFGGLGATRELFDWFREETRRAGFPGLHLNIIGWGYPLLPSDKKAQDFNGTLTALAADSVGSYVWVHNVPLKNFPLTDYRDVMLEAIPKWKTLADMHPVEYHPNVSTGWDSTMRTALDLPHENAGYPYMASISNDTPELFEEALRAAKEFMASRPDGHRIITLNAWNEWTEGSYLEPDTRYGMGKLEAVKRVFNA